MLIKKNQKNKRYFINSLNFISENTPSKMTIHVTGKNKNCDLKKLHLLTYTNCVSESSFRWLITGKLLLYCQSKLGEINTKLNKAE